MTVDEVIQKLSIPDAIQSKEELIRKAYWAGYEEGENEDQTRSGDRYRMSGPSWR